VDAVRETVETEVGSTCGRAMEALHELHQEHARGVGAGGGEHGRDVGGFPREDG
jgi:hypothetical protein